MGQSIANHGRATLEHPFDGRLQRTRVVAGQAGSTAGSRPVRAVVHRALRRETRLIGELIAMVAPGDVKRSAVLAWPFQDVHAGLVHHHEGEDELLWPPMLARAGLEREVVSRMEVRHERIVETSATGDALVKAWSLTADAESRDRLVAAPEEHREVLVEHLDDEGAHLLPLAERSLTLDEWNSLSGHVVLSTPRPSC